MSIAHFRTHTPSQREIFPFRTATPSQSEIFFQSEIFSPEASHNNRFRTNTSSQSEIFSELSNASYSSNTETGMSTDIREEYTTPSQTSSEVTSSAYSSDRLKCTMLTTLKAQLRVFRAIPVSNTGAYGMLAVV